MDDSLTDDMDPRRLSAVRQPGRFAGAKRLKGYGLGVAKVESVDRGRSLVIHTATGEHLRRLEALLADVIVPPAEKKAHDPKPGSSGGDGETTEA